MEREDPHRMESPDQATPEAQRPLAESIRELEDLELSDKYKTEIVLILAGEKPATNISVTRTIYRPGEPAEPRDHAAFDSLVSWTAASGLPHEVTDRRINVVETHLSGTNGQWHEDQATAAGRPIDVEAKIAASNEWDQLTLYVAKDPVWLEKIKYADQTNDLERCGEAYGFPPTAIAAYASHNYLTPAEAGVPEELQPFAQYGFSPDHAAEDIKTAQRWASAVRELDPDLYQRLTNVAH